MAFDPTTAVPIDTSARQASQQGMRFNPATAKPEPETIGQMITGSARMTPEVESAPELGASGLFAGEDKLTTLRLAPTLLTTTDPMEAMNIITSNLPHIQPIFNRDARGNLVPMLYNPKNQVSTVINKAGFTGMDAMQMLGLGSLFALSPQRTVGQSALGAGVIGAGIEGAQTAEGGTFDKSQPLIEAGLGGAGKIAENVVESGVRYAKARQSPVPDTPEQQAVDFAKQQGVPVLTSDIRKPETFVEKGLQQTGERIPVTGTGAQRAEQEQARRDLVERYVHGQEPYSPAVVMESLKNSADKTRRLAGQRMSNIESSLTGVNISTTNAIDAIDGEIYRLTHNPNGTPRNNVDQTSVSALEGMKDDLLNDPSFENYKRTRTEFRERVKGDRTALPTTASASVDRVYAGMTNDMRETIGSELGDRAVDRWGHANKIYAEESRNIKQSRIKNALEKGETKPEIITNMLLDKSPSQIKLLYRSLDDAGKRNARSGLVAHAFQKSDGVPNRFLNELNKLERQTGIFFRGDDRKMLNGLKNYLQHTRRAAEAGVMTNTGQQAVNTGATMGLLYDLLSPSGTRGAATGTALLYGAMANIYERPAVRDLLLKIGSVPAGSTQSLKLIEQISPMIRAEIQATASQQTQEEQERKQ